jgi:hypothetical protein
LYALEELNIELFLGLISTVDFGKDVFASA